MLFNSLSFIYFFAAVVLFYFSLPQRFRWILLLCASYYFYMCWKPEYILLIIFSTVLDYFLAIRIDQAENQIRRKIYLVFSLTGNLGILFAFKYFNFFNESAKVFFSQCNIFYDITSFNVLLPIGISFYTFQTLSYTIDVYRGTRKPEPHFGIFALYVSFFPQLVAGPIERSTHLLPQFRQINRFDARRVLDGLRIMLWGFFKKMVLADNLAVFVDLVYTDPGQFQAGTLVLATYCFAFQIYYDFSGYSDIAIGAGRVLGYDIMQNFRRPYLAATIAEFWTRWHISLSSWFRDYLYIPLGGNRVSGVRWTFNIMLVFLLSGMWHGAHWTFIAWGLMHGIYYLIFKALSRLANVCRISILHKSNRVFRRPEKRPIAFTKFSHLRGAGDRVFRVLGILIVFNLVSLAWIFFRAQSMGDASLIFSKIFTGPFRTDELSNIIDYPIALCVWGLFILITELLSVFEQKLPEWSQWCVYYFLIFAILIFGSFKSEQFIYFQF